MRDPIPGKWLLAATLVLGLSAAAPGTAMGEPNCTCRYAGQSFALKTCMCITTPSGARLACCNKVLNNTSWTFSDDFCPLASAPDLIWAPPVAWQLRPAAQERQRPEDRRLSAAMTK